MLMMPSRQAILNELRERISQFPLAPGVYLFKDAAGVVLYVGKAKSLRSRVTSYFQPSADLLASRGPDIERMVRELVVDVDFLPCQSEVDALLREVRLIKDIQPRFNAAMKDDKSFPYLQITTDEDFPRVAITREPRSSGVKLYGPFTAAADLRAAMPLLQRVFKFRTCKLDIVEGDESRSRYRPCILYNIRQCTAPCAGFVSADDYAQQIRHLRQFLESKGTVLKRELTAQMKEAAQKLEFEKAAELRDELKALEGLQDRGLVHEHVQPEVFFVDPTEGLARLAEVLGLQSPPRTIEGIDIAHLGGKETVGSLVTFIDGRPFKSGYRRFKVRTAVAGDDYGAIREVVSRRYRFAGANEQLFPDIILIDGGRGQLNAAQEALHDLEFHPQMLISLAKQEERIFVHGRQTPIDLPRRDPGLRVLQAVRDEAHRFAQHYHHILRRRATLGADAPPRSTWRKKRPSK